MIKKRTSNLDQMKKSWVQNGPVRSEEERVVRRFNQAGQSSKGRIKMDKDTYVIYDYSTEFPVVRLETPSSNSSVKTVDDKSGFIGEQVVISKFPVLSMISNGLMEDQSANKGEEMDLILNKSMGNAFLWKNGDFQYY
ncbi:MAG: hypothetical protein WD512_13910 [Candidatus Paceibacterota bacterium]